MARVATEVVLSAEKISKVYRMGAIDVHALREVDLELIRGDFIVYRASDCKTPGCVVVRHPRGPSAAFESPLHPPWPLC